MEPYMYEGLNAADAIRLLILQPSEDVLDSPIHCSLIHTTLAACDEDIIDGYTALSYVWGTTKDPNEVYVDGKPFPVTQNLFDALRDLRDFQRVQRLWIDAICINQADEKERNQQVSIMGSIYSSAHHTVIYLNPHFGDNSPFDMMKQYLANQDVVEVARQKVHMQHTALRILSSPWFTRVWVLQELVMSSDPRLQCGRYRMRWDAVYQFLQLLYQKEPPDVSDTLASELIRGPYQIFQDMNGLRRKYQQWKIHKKLTESPLLGDILQSRRGFGVLNARDMIFAHLGMVGDNLGQRVDYGQTVSQIFTNMAVRLLLQSEDLSWLSKTRPSHLHGNIEGLPSWVPDWTLPMDHHSQYKRVPSWNQAETSYSWKFTGQVMLSLKKMPLSDEYLFDGYYSNTPPSLLALKCRFLGRVEKVYTNTGAPSIRPGGHPSASAWKDLGVGNTLGFRQAFVDGQPDLSVIVPAYTRHGDYVCSIAGGHGTAEGYEISANPEGFVLREAHPIEDKAMITKLLKSYNEFSGPRRTDSFEESHILHATLVGECFYFDHTQPSVYLPSTPKGTKAIALIQ